MGDDVLGAGQAQRLFDADPSKRVAIVGMKCEVRWSSIWDGNPIIATPDDVAAGESVHVVKNGPGCRPYIVYPFTKQSGWTFDKTFKAREHVARIYLTDAERERGRAARANYGPYVLIEPFTKHENFLWPMDRWAEVVRACPHLTFVQHIHADSLPVPGAHYEMATFREACALAQFSELYVRSESGLCHAAAALGVPQVTLFGGCMDPEVMAGYPGQTVLADTGPGSPCGSWEPCAHCDAAMHRISVHEVVCAIRERFRAREVH